MPQQAPISECHALAEMFWLVVLVNQPVDAGCWILNMPGHVHAQSVVRGWIVRRRWHKNPEGVVTELKARIENEAKAEKRRAEMRQKLEVW